MKLHFTFLMTIFCFTYLCAQTVVDFEEFDLPAESFLNGDDGSGGFSSGDIFLNNDYNTEFMSWSGWAISNTSDVTTPGFFNQYSAITGSGFGGSGNYATTFAFGNDMIMQGAAAGQPISGMYITNSTYAYLSMLDGDAFSKKFGGVTGDDPDFFLLNIKAYRDGSLTTESVDFYLADFRNEDNTQDYIVDEWTWLDLSTLGAADSLSFTLTSSDVGQYGMNTPAYFCVDDIFSVNPETSTTTLSSTELIEVFPNPATDYIQISNLENKRMDCYIYNSDGRLVFNRPLNNPIEKISLQHLTSGIYTIVVRDGELISSKVVVKK